VYKASKFIQAAIEKPYSATFLNARSDK